MVSLSMAFHSFEPLHKIKKLKNSENLPNVIFYTHNLQDRWLFSYIMKPQGKNII